MHTYVLVYVDMYVPWLIWSGHARETLRKCSDNEHQDGSEVHHWEMPVTQDYGTHESTYMLNDILKVVEQQFSPFTFQLGPPAVVQTLHFREFIVKLALKQSNVLPIRNRYICSGSGWCTFANI